MTEPSAAASTEGIWTMTDSEFKAELRKAFVAGFTKSGEGWNGEYPFNFDVEQIDNALDGAFMEWHRGS